VVTEERAEQWRSKAEELRTAADNCRSLEAQRTYRRLADQYDLLADRTVSASDPRNRKDSA
jgi:hypothetical protein